MKKIINFVYSLLLLLTLSFPTFSQEPGEPYNPMTANGAEGVLPGQWFGSNHYLKWKNPIGIFYNQVYLSDDSLSVSNLDISARILNGYPNTVYNEVIPSYPNYEYFKKYFWRIVEYNSSDSTLGPVWYYRTRVWPGEIFEEHFDSLDQWAVDGPNGYNNWSLGYGGVGNDPPELQFNWAPQFIGTSSIKFIRPLPGGSGTFIQFKHLISWYTDTVTVGLALKYINGSSWTSIWEEKVGNNFGPETVSLNSSSIDEVFYLGFYYSGNSYNINNWFVDDLIFSHPIETYDPPGFLQVTEDTINQKVILNWTPGYSPGPLNYKIKRKIGFPKDTSSYYTIGYACNALLSFEDYDIQPNTIYTYRVHTVLPCPNSYYTSIGGNEATAYVPDIPTSFKTETKVVSEFSFEQNYPNPFNPVTKIKFDIPDQVQNDNRFVTLKVYDVLGNEVATLVNEQKRAGTYEVEFDGTGLPSGIYFYQIRAVDPSTGSGQVYVETKKMILLK